MRPNHPAALIYGFTFFGFSAQLQRMIGDQYRGEASSSRPVHPWLFMVLEIPFGVVSGYIVVTLALSTQTGGCLGGIDRGIERVECLGKRGSFFGQSGLAVAAAVVFVILAKILPSKRYSHS